MARQRQIRMCREGAFYSVIVLAVLTGSMIRQLNLLMLVGSIMAGLLLFAMIYGRLALRRLVIERLLPGPMHADERLVVEMSVTNCRRWLGIWGIEVQDVVSREENSRRGDEVGAAIFFPHVAGSQTMHATYAGRLPRRGLYRFGPLRVSTRFPLGLIRHRMVIDDRAELVVHPRLGRLTRDWALVARENPVGGQRMQRHGLLEADFHGLREWRPGDSRRWIHWRTSARRGGLVVRQFEQRRSQDLALLLDFWQAAKPTAEQLANVETAVSFVATLVAEACRHGDRQIVLAVASRASFCHSGPASPAFFREQMEALSLAEAHSDAEFPDALCRSIAVVPPRMSALIVSTRSIDWEAVRSAAAQHDVQIAGRSWKGLTVGSGEFARYFQI